VRLFYNTFDLSGTEKIRLQKKPVSVLLEYKPMVENKTGEGYTWSPMPSGGLLVIRIENGNKVILVK